MKITFEHYAYLNEKIQETLEKYNSNNELVELYEKGDTLVLNNGSPIEDIHDILIYRNAQCNDIQKRFCFDILYLTDISIWICDNLYPYLNDDHIYSALRNICPMINTPSCRLI